MLVKSSFQKGYAQNRPNKGVAVVAPLLKPKAPAIAGAFVFFIDYSVWSITHTPLECAGLARVLVIVGLDRVFTAKQVMRLMCPTVGQFPMWVSGGLRNISVVGR
jgi:hypothetical protein